MSIPGASGEQPVGRRLLFILSGVGLLVLALALLLFGNRSLGDSSQAKSVELERVPQFDEAQPSDLALGQGRPLDIGDIPLDFLLEDLDGNVHGLYDLRGKPVVINFWATWCAPCRLEMPVLQVAYDKHQKDGLSILAIDFDESPDTVRRFFYDELGLTFTPLLDEAGLVTQQFDVFNFPATFFIEPGGRVAAIHRGPMVLEQIEEHLAKIIPGPG